ncbi:MAG: LytTR family DNA-binding domain-containing protein [Lachnospiraceae bacterium]|nr:LytTR family DNA-binding domain-containing protein [Lachnospiraceae bacterium]
MYEIAICDDDQAEMDKVERMLHSYRRQSAAGGFLIRQFAGAEKLLFAVQQEAYQPDLIFMDIYMPGETGIDVAKKLRKMGNTSRIAFLTLSKEHALDAFNVDAVSYLVKPFSMEKLFRVLDKVLKELENEQSRYILVQADDHVQKIALCDVIYCEAQRKKQCIYLKGGDSVHVRMTMTRLCEMVADHKEFMRLGASYIVNLEHIERLSAQMLQLDNGEMLYLPRGSYKNLREKYFDYYFGGDE